jgi:hypothetical protein
MRFIMNICGVLIAIYSLYYQVAFFIFNNLTRSSQTVYNNSFLKETLPQLLIIVICLIFLYLNVKAIMRGIKGKQCRKNKTKMLL